MKIEIILFTTLVGLSFSALAEKVEPKVGSQCFKFLPDGPIDDKKCAAVKTSIQFSDCTTQAPLELISDVSAKFECKHKPKRLKYWHKDTMLYAVVDKKNGKYEITSTNSLVYSTKDPTTAVISSPSAIKEVG